MDKTELKVHTAIQEFTMLQINKVLTQKLAVQPLSRMLTSLPKTDLLILLHTCMATTQVTLKRTSTTSAIQKLYRCRVATIDRQAVTSVNTRKHPHSREITLN